MIDKAWLDTLKPGDVVGVMNHWWARRSMVARLTATQFVMGSGSRYRRKDGSAVSNDAWHHTYLCPVDDARFVAKEAEGRRSELREQVKRAAATAETPALEAALAALTATSAATEVPHDA